MGQKEQLTQSFNLFETREKVSQAVCFRAVSYYFGAFWCQIEAENIPYFAKFPTFSAKNLQSTIISFYTVNKPAHFLSFQPLFQPRRFNAKI
jgi:hypothetical protein